MLDTLKFDHLGIAVKNIDRDLAVYTALGFRPVTDLTECEAAGVKYIYLIADGGPMIELIADLKPGGPMSGNIAAGRKLFQMAYKTDDLERDVGRLTKEFGAIQLGPVCESPTHEKGCSLMLKNRTVVELVQGEKPGMIRR